MTLRHALSAIEARGLVIRAIGRNGGTFVQGSKIACDLNQMVGFTEQLKKNGLEPGARVLTAEVQEADSTIAKALDLPPGAPVYFVERLRLANGVEVAIENSWFPAEMFEGLLDMDLGASIYSILSDRYNSRPVKALETLDAVALTPRQSALFGSRSVRIGLQIERLAYAMNGIPVEFAHDIFRADMTKITIWAGIGGTG